MKICIRKEPNGSYYVDKTAINRFTPAVLQQPPYNFSFVEVPLEDFENSDFNDDLTFSIEKYNQRKNKIVNDKRIAEIKAQLSELTKDFAQVQASLIIENIEEKKQQFRELHSELRTLLGKEPREESQNQLPDTAE